MLVVTPNGGESLYRGDTNTITWESKGLTGTVKLELLVNGEVAGTIAENLPNTQTSYQWPTGKLLSGWMNPGSNFKVRVSSVIPATTAVTTYYFYSIDGRLLAEYDGNGNCVKDYIYMGNRLIAEYQPLAPKYYYYTTDQINSTRIITDSNGTVVYSALFDPYGGMQKEGVNTYQPSLKFSGKERESSSDYDYFGARYYGHNQYRFLSVDPIINKEEALANPQLWNLYSYCRNSPVTYSDPNGTYEKDVHYYLTKHLALQAGFSKSDAEIIASSNQSIDTNSTTSANPRYAVKRLMDNQKEAWHFASDQRVAEVITKAFATRDRSELGSALHCFQDSLFAHKRYRGNAEHAIESLFTNPDDTSRNVGMALEMAQGTLDILNAFMGNGKKSINLPFLKEVFKNKNSESRAQMLE